MGDTSRLVTDTWESPAVLVLGTPENIEALLSLREIAFASRDGTTIHIWLKGSSAAHQVSIEDDHSARSLMAKIYLGMKGA